MPRCEHPIGGQRDDGTVPYLPTVVASVDQTTGQRAYLYGWARQVVHGWDRDVDFLGLYEPPDIREREYTTTVEWAAEPTWVKHYPGQADWVRGRELAQAARPAVTLADPAQLAAGG